MHIFPLNTPVVVRHKRDGRLIAGAVSAHRMVSLDGGAQLPALHEGHPLYDVQIGPETYLQADESQLTEVLYGD